MYTVSISEGTVTRMSDGKIVAPCQSPEEPDFVEYINWVNAGNHPNVVE